MVSHRRASDHLGTVSGTFPGVAIGILFAHGAGAPSSSAWMQRYATLLARFGRVVSFDYPYMAAGRSTPDRLPALVAAHRKALADLRREHAGPVVLAGKSMGGRIGCHVANDEDDVAGLLCFGYPLRSQQGVLRDEVLRALRRPVFFAQGTRDALCPLPTLETVRSEMSVHTELHVVPTGDHSLLATKTHLRHEGTSQEDLEAALMDAIGRFLARLQLR